MTDFVHKTPRPFERIVRKRITTGDKELDLYLKPIIDLAEELDDHGRHPVYDRNYGPPLGNRYLWYDIACHVHIFFKKPIGRWQSQNFCIKFNRLALDEILGKGFSEDLQNPHTNIHSCGVVCTNIDSFGNHYCWQKKPVLVRVREVAKDGEWVKDGSEVVHFVDSAVRLKLLDQCDMRRFNLLEKSGLIFSEFDTIVGDRKLSGSGVLQIVSGMPSSEFKDGVIQDAAEIVDDISESNADRIQEVDSVGNVINEEDILSATNIELDIDSWTVRFNFEKAVNVGLKGISVFLSPHDFRPASSK